MASAADPSSPTDAFMPHGMCYLWRPDVLSLHIVSDALIAIAYFTIPFTLLYFVRRRRDLEFNWMFVCFATFIVACGTTHLMDIWVIWHPVYWLSGAIKAITALASVPTAFLLARLVPSALKLPNPASLRHAYAELEKEIAERCRTEEDLRAANAQLKDEAARGRLAAIVESCDDAIISITPDGTITTWNHGAEKLFGYTESEAIGHSAAMLFPPECASEELDILSRIRLGERITSFEAVRIRKDGQRIDVSASVSPMRDANGTIVGASKIVCDISQRKRADEELAEQTKILDLAQVMVRDMTGRILRWSRGSEKLYGFSTKEALGAISHELLRTCFAEPLEAINAQLERDGVWEGELTHRTRDGTEINVVSVWALHRDGRGGPPRVLESNSDVTERKRAEARLAAQLGRLDLLNAITRAIGERQDLPSIFQVAIGTLEDQLPVDFACLCLYRPPDVLVISGVGVKSHDLALQLDLTDQAHLPIGANGLSRCVSGQLVYEPDMRAVPFAFPRRIADAGLNAMVAAPLLLENNVFGALIVARRAANSFSSGECEFLGQLGQHIALAAHQAQLYSALEAAYDDLRQTQQAVMRQEKLRVLGQMASGIAHDINNALSPAALYVEALLDREPGQSETKDYLVIIQRAIDGVAQTVARMKEFYSQRDPRLTHAPVALNLVAKQVIDLTRARWNSMPQESGRVICVDTDLAPDLPAIVGNQSEISDALTNLILNSVDAMPGGGRITVRSRAVAGDRVQLDVTDTGIGMDEATKNRCLELFFTTKGVRGTGLGLAMVYGTVERHGGELQIESGLGEGTNIRLTFPAAVALPPTGIMAATQPAVQRPLRILVIDDDPIILESLRDILERCGHFIGVADGGQRGIDTFRAAHDRCEPFEVVITDLGMPHIDGRTVAAAVKSLEPKTRVILLTGWGHRMLVENDAPANVDRVLGKPPKLANLRVALAELTLVVST
jgi:PAS domain S-box-containing protein